MVLPAGVLVTLAVRVNRQEAELAEKRLGDERRDATEQLRRELAARLDAIRLQEANRLAAQGPAPAGMRTKDSPVLFTAAIEEERLVPPWSQRDPPGRPTAAFLAYQHEGEAREFLGEDYTGATAIYRRALTSARSPDERCRAQLWLGRALLKARSSEASGIYKQMLDHCESLRDEDGISYGLYAAERLLNAALDGEAARAYVLNQSKAGHWRAPTELHLLRSLLAGVHTPEAESARVTLTSDIDEGEAILALASDIHRLRRLDASVHSGGPPEWIAHGGEPWFVTVISSDPFQARPTLLAVSSAKVLPPGVRLVTSSRSPPLGEGFPGLYVEWPPERFVTSRAFPHKLLMAGVVTILGVTLLSGYLLLRDVDRDVQLAEMRARFVSSVSHELKTPLTSIRMFAETLALGRHRTNLDRSEYLHTIVNESERLSRLVDNVLDVTRIEEGRRIYQMQPVSLAEVVDSAVRAVQYPLSQQGFQLDLDVANDLPPVTADRDALQQALLNLIANAMKYSGDSRTIALRLRRQEGDAAIDVIDRGIGIDESHQDQIFEKYYRVRSTDTDRVPGAGLGLTLAMHAVAAHGGRLLVSSALGRGSTFTVRIPFARQDTAV
jgi:signal transduction histidine kinase